MAQHMVRLGTPEVTVTPGQPSDYFFVNCQCDIAMQITVLTNVL